jgi:hypothetical protein
MPCRPPLPVSTLLADEREGIGIRDLGLELSPDALSIEKRGRTSAAATTRATSAIAAYTGWRAARRSWGRAKPSRRPHGRRD